MTRYQYTAFASKGEKIRGFLDAKDLASARSSLKSKGVQLLEIKEKRSGFSFGQKKSLDLETSVSKNKSDKIAHAFLVKFHQLIKNGMPVGDTAKTLASRLKDPTLNKIAGGVWKELSDGETIASALGRYDKIFDPSLLHMLEAGEATGNLEPVLVNMIDRVQARINIRKKIASGLAYPIFVSLIAFFVVIFFLFYLLPRIEMMLQSMGGEMSWSAALILWLAEAGFTLGPVFVIGSLILSIAINQWRKNSDGKLKTDACLLKFPVINKIVINAEQSRIANLAYTLLGSGVSATECLKLIEKGISNDAFKLKFRAARNKVNDGESFSDAFAEMEIFEDMDTDVLAIAENTGRAVEGFESLYKSKYELIEDHMRSLTLGITSVALIFAFSLVVLLTFGIATSILQLSKNIVGS
jgi:general secretion pathway protein F